MGLIGVVELLPGALDSQLQRDAGVSHFEYMVLAKLSEAPDRTLRMTALAAHTNSTLARLSHVISRLVNRGFVERIPCRRTNGPRTLTSPMPVGCTSGQQHPATSRRPANW